MEILRDLQSKNLITDEVAARVEARVAKGQESYEEALLAEGVSADAVRTSLAEYYMVPAFELGENETIDTKVLAHIPEESAKHYMLAPVRVEDGVLMVASNDPENLQVRDVLNFISSKLGMPYKLLFGLVQDIEKAHEAYENLTGEVDEALSSLEVEIDSKSDPEKKKAAEKQVSEHIKEDAPVTKIVATILRYAVDGSASDIHVEPTDSKVRVRFRVDGQLATSLELPIKVHPAVVARVKILSSMRLDEKRKPQDGRFSATFDGRKIDFRVSVLPTSHGEKIVMRILDNARGVTTLEDTGISDYHLEAIRRMVNEPYGIILISGPTGSGKSTTLYAMLGEVDKMSKNVLSLEDPVEYNIEGVSQSQVRPEIGYTFSEGLRSALRQDPDVILVGEIRDKETAQLAIQAALTGHLVLSTIHTNNSIGVVPRLIDMGVDPYLIAPTLKLALAQRLARRICPNSGTPIKVEGALATMVEKEFETLPEQFRDRIPQGDTMLRPEPSPGCTAGTKGRVAVMEALEVNEEIEALILNGGSEEDIYNVARKNGFMSIKEDAIIKGLQHVIPYEEVSIFGTKVGQENVLDEEDVFEAPEQGMSPQTDSSPGQTSPVDNNSSIGDGSNV